MIGKDLNRKFGLAEEVTVVRERVNDRIEFFVGTVPSFFTVFELMMKEEKRVPTIVIFLFHGAGVGDIGGVGGKSDGFVGVKGAEKDIIPNGGYDLLEGGSVEFGDPFPRDVLFKEIVKAGGGVGVMGDEAVIEANDSEEAAKLGDSFWRVDIADALDLVVGHSDAFSTLDGVTEEIALLAEPFAFVGFEAEAVFLEGLEDFEYLVFVVFEGTGGVNDNVIEVGVAEDPKIRIED